jgi:hypothetical protein
MKKIRIGGIALILSAFLLIFNSCTKDFEKINTNPNAAGLDKASPSMLLTDAIEVATDRVQEIFLGEEMGNCWAQHEAKVQYTDEDRYIYRTSVVNNTWTSFYANSGMDVQVLYDVAKLKQHDNYKGIALVLKSYISSVLTDLFGPVPYSQAWTGTANTLPAYDSQEVIYRDIIAKLDTANTILTEDGKAIEGDILFNNDILKWKKFANSLRMRLLLRMSAKDAAFVTAEMTKMAGDAAKYPIFESNEDNAALQYLGSAPNNHPINENRKTRDDHRISKTLVDMMWTNATGMDYRIGIYATPYAAGQFEGLPNGMTSSAAAAYKGNGLKNTCKIGSYFSAATCPGMLMSYSELQFILAEAAFKGYIPGGNDKAGEYYTEGIYGSYNQFGDALVTTLDGEGFLTDKQAATWTADSLAADFIATEGLQWDASNAMELIATQRWCASFDQGLQSWFEWRRTGYPVLTPAVSGMNNGKIPVRVPYPTDEAARNPSSLAAGVTLLGGPDDLNTKVWWNK